MLAMRRSVATALLGITCAVVVLVYPSAIDRRVGVASADENVRIESPVDGASVTGRIDIRVTVTASDSSQIDFYRIYVGNGRSPSAMRPLGPPHTTEAVNEALASLDTGLLQPGEATIQLRMYPKNGEEIDAVVVVIVQTGPAPTRTFSGPIVVVPPVATPSSKPATVSGVPSGGYPVEVLPDVEIPEFAPSDRPIAPIPRLNPENIYDWLPGDPVQDDPMLTDIEIAPIPLPTPYLAPIPPPAPYLAPIPR